jgi:hypothetical protein
MEPRDTVRLNLRALHQLHEQQQRQRQPTWIRKSTQRTLLRLTVIPTRRSSTHHRSSPWATQEPPQEPQDQLPMVEASHHG